jgi:hypothetical protein
MISKKVDAMSSGALDLLTVDLSIAFRELNDFLVSESIVTFPRTVCMIVEISSFERSFDQLECNDVSMTSNAKRETAENLALLEF